MPKIARPYDYQDPRDPSDALDRFEQPDYEPRDKNGGSAERGQPFTWAEIEYFEFRQGITMCPTPVQPEPKLPGLTKMQEAWALTFDPLAGVSDAVADLSRRISTSSKQRHARSLDKARARPSTSSKASLEGGTFADVAAEMSQDRAVISRDMADTYAKWPKLEPAITLLNSLNNMAKRARTVNCVAVCLQRGEQIIDDGVLIWGEWPNSGPRNHVADPDHVVKLAELQHKAFPPIRSNFGASVAAISHVTPGGEVMWEGVAEPWNTARRIRPSNKWGYETERTDGSVRIGAFKDYDVGIARLSAWQGLRETAGLPDKYFHEETDGHGLHLAIARCW